MTIPYFLNYQPLASNGIECRSIDDMVSISALQVVPITKINYNIGSQERLVLPYQIKNLTNNAQLQISIKFDSNVFLINNRPEPISVILASGETRQFNISINANQLDRTVGNFKSLITVDVKNISNGTVVTRTIGTTTLANTNIGDMLILTK